MSSEHTVPVEKARFSLLTPHLARLQYAPIDDRPSMRALTRPEPLPFSEVSQADGVTILRGDHITIHYRPDAAFDADNLRVAWQAGGRRGEWHPGVVDPHNLGGTVFSLDNINADFAPVGVHPAGLDEDQIEARTLYNGWVLRDMVREDLRARYGQRYPPGLPVAGRVAREHWLDLSEKTQRAVEDRRRYPPGVLSRSGYSVLNDSHTARLDPDSGWQAGPPPSGAQDWYFFAYGQDYAQALRDFVTLCGRVPMLPRWALGHWYSYWNDVGDAEQRARVAHYEENDLPLDVFVLDMQWHKPSHWCGFDWHPDLFPNPRALLDWFHKRGLRVPLNLHFDGIPLDTGQLPPMAADLGIDLQAQITAHQSLPTDTPSNETPLGGEGIFRYNLGDRAHAEAFFKRLIEPLYEDGVDFFWLDGQNGDTPGMNNQLWTNHLFYTDLQQRRPDRRPLILSRYGGLGGHRYPVGFSGDTYSDWETLAYQVEMTARAGNVGQVYWSHDLGGHMHAIATPVGLPMDPELYIRWMQFGALSPIARLHSTYGCKREIWEYGPRFVPIVREALSLRMSLLPYFYHLSHVAYESGLPLCRPLYLHYPQDEAAYEHLDEYLLGDRLLVAPITEAGGVRRVYLPEGKWWSWLPAGTHAGSAGPLFAGPSTWTLVADIAHIPVYARAGSLLPRQPVARRAGVGTPDPLIVEVYPHAPGETASHSLALYEDDGESMAYRDGAFSRLPMHLRADDETITVSVEGVRGEYDGMPVTRRYEVRCRFVKAPRVVEFNGVPLPSARWQWDESSGTLNIVVGKLSARDAWEVTVRL